MAQQIQLRRGTASAWTSANPTLAEGEAGVEVDTGKVKFGDGATAWVSLSYFGGSGDVVSVNGATGVVVLDADDIDDTATTNKFATAAQLSDVDGLATTYQPLDADLTTLAAGNIPTNLNASLDSLYVAIGDEGTIVAVATYSAGWPARPTADIVFWVSTDVAATAPGAATGDDIVILAQDPDILKADTSDTLTVGFDSSDYAAGTKSTGTYTPAAADGNFQVATNGGAHTLAPPATSCAIVIHYTNNGSAGTITTSGFTVVNGDSFTTTDTHEFLCYVTKVNDVSHLNVVALQ